MVEGNTSGSETVTHAQEVSVFSSIALKQIAQNTKNTIFACTRHSDGGAAGVAGGAACESLEGRLQLLWLDGYQKMKETCAPGAGGGSGGRSGA